MHHTPKSLISNGIPNYGSYHDIIKNINMLDQKSKYHLPKFIKNYRLKEWEAIQLFNEDFFIISAVLNAKNIGVIQTVYIDRKTNTKHIIHKKTYHRFTKINQGLYDSNTSYHDDQNQIIFHNDAAQHIFSININHIRDHINCQGVGLLHGTPLSIFFPFENENSLYSCKMVMPFYGSIKVNDQTLNADNSVLIIDDHKGFYPYHMKYQWATAAMNDKGIIRAFNFTSNDLKDGDQQNENVVWIGKKIHHFKKVNFFQENDQWLIKDKENRVNLTFTPEHQFDQSKNFGIVKTEYHSPIGYFNGTIRLNNYELLEIKNWYGMAEDINHKI